MRWLYKGKKSYIKTCTNIVVLLMYKTFYSNFVIKKKKLIQIKYTCAMHESFENLGMTFGSNIAIVLRLSDAINWDLERKNLQEEREKRLS